ncbi:COBRA-like protein 4 [Linum perenne]
MRLCFHFPAVLLVVVAFSQTDAYDPLDPHGRIHIKWDVMSWTPDGYVAAVTMTNVQMYRHIASPGWTMGWRWAKKEVIWSMLGAQAADQGDCSNFKGNLPHCCKRDPTVVDLLPGVPKNQKFTDCCKGGVLASRGGHDDAGASTMSSFQLTVGHSGTSNRTVRLPQDFYLLGPGPGYTCSGASVGTPSVFYSTDGRRRSQALMTWNVVCSYSQIIVSKNPSCCVSLSSFYNPDVTPCPSCACGCQTESNCINYSDHEQLPNVPAHNEPRDNSPLLQCTHHMCPVRVHWHVKVNYKDYWRAKIAVTNFNYRMNYTQWTLVVQHPNLNNVTQVFSFDYKPLVAYQSINDTGMFYGTKFYNDLLMEAGPFGNVQSEVLLMKDKNTFTFKQGWAFPRKVYFNGDECMLPPPDSYPFLPNAAFTTPVPFLTLITAFFLLMLQYIL